MNVADRTGPSRNANIKAAYSNITLFIKRRLRYVYTCVYDGIDEIKTNWQFVNTCSELFIHPLRQVVTCSVFCRSKF